MKLFSSLKYRIAITIFCTGFILLLIVLFTTLAHIEEGGRKQLDSIAQTSLSMLVEAGRTAVLISDYTDLQPYVETISRETSLNRIDIANGNGVIVASSIPLDIGQQLSLALKGPGWLNRDITNSTGKIGSVHIQPSFEQFNTLIEESRRIGIIYGLVGLLGIALLSIVMGRLLTRRLSKLEDLTRKYGEGEFLNINYYQGSDEISLLGNSINQMMEKIKASIEKLKQSEEALKLRDRCLQNAENGILITDARAKNHPIIYCNQGFTRLTGYSAEEVLGKNCRMLQGKKSDRTTALKIKQAIAEGKPIQATILNYRKDGSTFWNKLNITPVHDQDGTLIHFVGVQTDITENVNLSLKLNYHASHDSLTQLINRREFESRLKRLLSNKKQEQAEHVLCYFDLDQFKMVNDTCGHEAGDNLLREISHIMLTNIRQRDTLARFGGDEFALLMEHCSLEDGLLVAGKLKQAIGDYEFKWDTTSFRVGVSMGLVAIDTNDGDISEILKKADNACYVAKERGRNRIHIYNDQDIDLNDRQDQVQWAIKIQNAIGHDQFRLFLQPIVPVTETNHHGKHYEVLLRLKDDRNLIMPQGFLPAAERYQMLKKIDYWVVEHLLKYVGKYPSWYEELYLCCINLSGLSLDDEDFMLHIDRMFKTTGVPPEKICFEITENAAIKNLSRASDFIIKLRSRGCRFALDDFGSGLSSFIYLKNLPVDFLKIDGEFIRDIDKNPTSRVMVKSFSEISEVMGKQTMAECVENEDTLNYLRQVGINYAQGHYLGRPRPLNEVIVEQNQNRSVEVDTSNI